MPDLRMIARRVANDWAGEDLRIADAMRALDRRIAEALDAERARCIAAICPRCAQGEPIRDADECMTLGHFERAGTCHAYPPGPGHIRCAAWPIRALFRANDAEVP